ncbi:MAG: CaiB/BaiF CoA transferase family protein [Gammaproteobacteria bacterium]
MTASPFSGDPAVLKVLDAGTMMAGPFAATLLGDYGADVIKIERRGGDIQRYIGPGPTGLCYRWQVDARNKRCITLDIRKPEGQALYRRLAAWADVLIENNRPGAMERLGLGYEQLRAVNPRLVYVRVSGFGDTGPYRDRPGYDFTGAAFGGLTAVTGYPDRPPVLPGFPVLDYSAGMFAAIGALEALRRRDAPGGSGAGEYVDLALYEPVLRISQHALQLYATEGIVQAREGGMPVGDKPPQTTHGWTYETRDGHYISAFPVSVEQFQQLARLLGDPVLLAPGAELMENRTAISPYMDRVLRPWIRARDRDEVLAALVAADVACAPVNDARDLYQDPHIRARGNIVETMNTRGEPLAMPGVIPRFAGRPGTVRWTGEDIGASNEAVFQGLLGLPDDEYRRLIESQVI